MRQGSPRKVRKRQNHRKVNLRMKMMKNRPKLNRVPMEPGKRRKRRLKRKTLMMIQENLSGKARNHGT